MSFNLNRFCASLTHRLSVLMLTKTLSRCCSRYESDVLDDFTSQLMQRQITKWDLRKRKNEDFIENGSRIKDNTNRFDIKNLGSQELGLLFQNAIDVDENESIMQLVNLCVQENRVPSFTILLTVLMSVSQKGDKDTVHRIEKLAQTHYANLLKENSNFRHFVAKAIWVKGDISRALEIFEETYRENGYLRRRIRLMLKQLISQLVSNGSEAALGNMIGFSERLCREFNDYYPLTCVWQACFLSEWFSDQCIAFDLLERNPGLCKFVINRIPYVVFVSLRSNRTEIVYRLVEILLKYNMTQQYSSVLVSLLDYHFRRMDWMRCSEIFRWASNNNVALPQSQHVRLINLILHQKVDTPLAPLKEKSGEKPNCNLKF